MNGLEMHCFYPHSIPSPRILCAPARNASLDIGLLFSVLLISQLTPVRGGVSLAPDVHPGASVGRKGVNPDGQLS